MVTWRAALVLAAVASGLIPSTRRARPTVSRASAVEENTEKALAPAPKCPLNNEGQLLDVREVKPMGGALSIRATVRYRRLARDGGDVGAVGPQLVRLLLTAPTPAEHNRWLEVLRLDVQLGGARRKSILKAAR